MEKPEAMFLVLFLVTMSTHAHRHPSGLGANPGHGVAPLLGSLEKGPVPPSAPNPGTYIPAAAAMGSAVTHLLGSPEKGPLRPSAPNPGTYIPPAAAMGSVVAPLLGSPEKGSLLPSG